MKEYYIRLAFCPKLKQAEATVPPLLLMMALEDDIRVIKTSEKNSHLTKHFSYLGDIKDKEKQKNNHTERGA